MKDDRSSAASGLHIVGWTADRAGVVQVVTAVAPDAPSLEYAFEAPSGDLYPVAPQQTNRSPSGNLNLIDTTDAAVTWVQVPTSSPIRFGTNLNEIWTLSGAETYYLGSHTRDEREGFSAAARLVDPVDGGEVPVRPLERYRFDLLAAAHRCTAEVTIEVLGADGSMLETLGRAIDLRYRGGLKADLYDLVRMEFIAPPGSVAARFTLSKGRTDRRDDSFVFFVRPEFRMLSAGESGDEAPVRLSREAVRFVRQSDRSVLERAVLSPPSELFRAGRASIDLVVGAAGDTARAGPIAVERAPDVTLDAVSLDRARLTVKGQALGGRSAVTLGVFVDGEQSGEATLEPTEGRLDTVMTFAAQHLDGLPHAVEIRLLPEQATLATLYESLPNRLTPWSAIQTLARSPVDVIGNPAAAHHFRAYRAWLKAARAGQAEVPAELSSWHDALLEGFRKRADYPVLRFPEHAEPTVSIVIPAHNKFEVTHHCLTSLLFAHNHATFEVILVDDGSTDETSDAERFVSGVRIVRHAQASGFVGACNDGAAEAKGRYVCFLNNDTEVTAGWLDELVRGFEAFEGVGLTGAKLVYPDGRLQEAGGVVWRSGNPWNVGRGGNASDPAFNYLRQVDYLSGAAIMLPADVWREVGGFSAEFAPGYFEDTDLAMKVRASGRRVVYVPTATVIHFEGQSSGTDVAAGMKRFQEVNRPKFKRRWGSSLLGHGVEGVRVDREKDRGVAFRVLFVDQRCPQVDSDAGSYAAFQEIRLLQACGAKVTFLPRNLAWMDRHTLALQRIGVECLYAPFVLDFVDYVRAHAADYDVVYVNRYRIAEQLLASIRAAAPAAKVVLNLADLHFLRELREAEAGTPGYSFDDARQTRAAELAVVRGVDLTLSYSDVELAVMQSHLDGGGRTAKLPWVVDADASPRPAFADTRDLLFLGGFGHPPNVQAVRFFVEAVAPLLAERLPDAVLQVVGSQPPAEIAALESDRLRVLGQVADLDPVFRRSRLFVAPLLAGAGIKGKVLEAMARGSAMVLSPVAAEGTGLVDGADCLIASTPSEWADAVVRLYNDEGLWVSLGAAARRAAGRFDFASGVQRMQDVLTRLDIFGAAGLHYRHARPDPFDG